MRNLLLAVLIALLSGGAGYYVASTNSTMAILGLQNDLSSKAAENDRLHQDIEKLTTLKTGIEANLKECKSIADQMGDSAEDIMKSCNQLHAGYKQCDQNLRTATMALRECTGLLGRE